MKKIKLLALIMAVITGATLFLYLRSLNTKPVETIKTNVIVAVTDIPENTTITKDMVTAAAISTDAVLSNTYDNASYIIGMTTNADIIAGEQIISNRLVEVGSASSGTLAYTIEPGMRAITIGVNDTSSLKCMINPGDSVDIIAQYEIEVEYTNTTGEPDTKTIPVAKLLLQNIKVLAVDQIMAQSGAVSYTTLTLEVTPEQALELSFSEYTGLLRAILRSPMDTEEQTVPNINLDGIMAGS